MSPTMSVGLRQLATSAAAACNSPMSTLDSADMLSYVMSSVISAHYDTCLHTSDKVVAGKFKYDTLMCNKPPVRFQSNRLSFMDDKRTHKTVVLKRGNQYSVIGIKHITQ